MAKKALYKGRQTLVSDLKAIGSRQVMLDELERILPIFIKNQQEIDFLQQYHAGDHPHILKRTKTVRKKIDNKIIINYAYSAVRDIVGYYLGKPIQYVHMDSDKVSTEKITELNRILKSENKDLANNKIANDQSITGVGYLGIFKTKNKRNGTSLKLSRCNPINTFVVYSSDPEIDELYCVTLYTEQEDIRSGELPKTVYTVWTGNRRYDIKGDEPSGFLAEAAEITESNFSYGGYLPIQEYPNNMFRMGDFEPAIPIMDAIDENASDRSNDIAQTVQAILVAIGIDLKKEGVLEQLYNDGLLNIPGVSADAHEPLVQYVANPLDPNVGGSFSEYLESCMNVVIGVPDRKTRSGGGGDTGAAVELRDGWADIDLVASFKEGYFIEADRNSLGAILYLLKANREFDGVDVKDIEIKFSRNKTANVQSKSQALTAFIEAGVHPQDAIEWCDLTTDVLSVVDRMKEYREETQDGALEYAKKQQAALGVDDGVGKKNNDSTDQHTIR